MELVPKSNPGFWRWSICFVESSNFSRNWVFWCSKLSFRAETSEAAADFVASNSACNSEFIAYSRQTGSLNYHAPDLNRKRVSEDRPSPRFQILFEQLYYRNSTGENPIIFRTYRIFCRSYIFKNFINPEKISRFWRSYGIISVIFAGDFVQKSIQF